MSAPTAAVPLRLAVPCVLLGGIAGQLSGAIVAGAMRAVLGARGLPEAELERSALVVLPAMAVSTLTLLLASLLAPLLASQPVAAALGLRAQPLHVLFAAAVGTVALNPVGDALMRAMSLLLPNATWGVVELLNHVASTASPLWVWPIFALLPGLSEELMFRGVLQRAVGRGAAAIAVSAIAFALFHADPHHIAGVLPLAFFLAWLAARAGTVAAVVAHVANNTAAVLALGSEALAVGYGTERPMPSAWLPAGLGVSLACAWVIKRGAVAEPLCSPAVPCSSSRHVEHRPD